jgi:hypothetical protein
LALSQGFATLSAVAPRWHPQECKVCGARWPHVYISATGLCPDHSVQRMARNIVSLRTRTGDDFEKWAQGIARGVVRTVRSRQSEQPAREVA